MKTVKADKVEIPNLLTIYAECPNCGSLEIGFTELRIENGFITSDEGGTIHTMCDECMQVFKIVWSRAQAVMDKIPEDEEDD